jgi:hypothetical protein
MWGGFWEWIIFRTLAVIQDQIARDSFTGRCNRVASAQKSFDLE